MGILKFKYRRTRGSALSLVVVVSIVMTALVTAMAWVAGSQSANTSTLGKLDSAFYAAETGLQRLAWGVRNNLDPTNTASVLPDSGSAYGNTLTGTYYYVTTWSPVTVTVGGQVLSASTFDITSVASQALATVSVTGDTATSSTTINNITTTNISVGMRAVGPAMSATAHVLSKTSSTVVLDSPAIASATSASLTFINEGATYTLTERMTAPGGGMSAVYSGGSFTARNTAVTGNVAVAGQFTDSSGHGGITGDLTYDGSAPNSPGDISGTTTKVPVPALDWATLETGLQSAGGAPATAGTGQTYDFTVMAGSNKVIYVHGDITNPIIKGAGTLYVDGDVTFSSSTTVGSSTNPVNLVATGTVSFTKNNNTVYGSVYSPGTLDISKFDVNGYVCIGGNVQSNSGSSTITEGTLCSPAIAAPWFDPRSNGGTGSAKMTLTQFTGPSP